MAHAKLPNWHWAYLLFRFGDGTSHALIPLVPLLMHDLPIWSVAAVVTAMNLVAVPASYLWGALMERTKGVGRRRLAIGGFSVATVSLFVMALPLHPVLFVLAAVMYTAFGVATAPAASVLVLEGARSDQWSSLTARLSRSLGWSYLLGVLLVSAWGLTGTLDFALAFVISGAASMFAAVWAYWSIEPAARRDAATAKRAARLGTQPAVTPGETPQRFDRPVWFPSRLRSKPTLEGLKLADGDPKRLLTGYFLMFAGSTVFFASYAGVLSVNLALPLGMVLLAQAPSHIINPLTYGYAGRFATRFGEMRGIGVGIALRVISIPALMAIILLMQADGYALILVAHAVAGLSFSFMQVNGVCLMAKVHRGGRGQGVGNFHAAVGLGSLVGAATSFLLLLWLPVEWTYIPAAGAILAGAAMVYGIRRSTQFIPRNLDG